MQTRAAIILGMKTEKSPFPNPPQFQESFAPVETDEAAETSEAKPTVEELIEHAKKTPHIIMNPVMPKHTPLTAAKEKAFKKAADREIKAGLKDDAIKALPVGVRFLPLPISKSPFQGPDHGSSTTALIPEGPLSFSSKPDANKATEFYIRVDNVTIAGLMSKLYGPFPLKK